VRASDDLLRQQADAAIARLAGLRERVLPSDDGLVPEVLEELSVALHELQVTADELHEQNEALAAAEIQVASERTRYRRLFEFSPDGYFVTDDHGIIREANRTGGKLLGRPSPWLVGKPLAVFVPIRDRARFRLLLTRLASERAVHTFASRLASAGNEFFALLRVQAVPPGEGRDAIELWWTLRDVTQQRATEDALTTEVNERRQAEMALRRSERRYRNLVEHAQEFVYELDARGHITYCNPMATKAMLGHEDHELIGRSFTDFVPREHRRSVREFTRRLMREEQAERYIEFPLCRADRTQVWVDQRAAALEDVDGQPSVLGVCRDVTLIRDKLQALQESGEQFRGLAWYLQEQLEAERARIAHDVHDELGAALTRLRMDVALPDPDRDGRDPRTQALLARIDDALALVRRTCDSLRPSLLDNMGLCAAIEWLAASLPKPADFHFELALHGLPEELPRDRATALFRIVQEAVTNTMRHADATTLSISQRCVGNDIIIDVVDDGRGIRADERDGGKSFGIFGMRQRASALGGSVHIVGGRQGTHVTVRVPMRQETIDAHPSG